MDLLTRLRQCCQEREEAIRQEAGLSSAEYACLNATPADQELSVGALSSRMGLSKSRGGRVVDQLVRRGLLRRRADAADRRIATVELTEQGEAVQQKVTECIDTCERALRSRLSPAQQTSASQGLATVLQALEEA